MEKSNVDDELSVEPTLKKMRADSEQNSFLDGSANSNQFDDDYDS